MPSWNAPRTSGLLTMSDVTVVFPDPLSPTSPTKWGPPSSVSASNVSLITRRRSTCQLLLAGVSLGTLASLPGSLGSRFPNSCWRLLKLCCRILKLCCRRLKLSWLASILSCFAVWLLSIASCNVYQVCVYEGTSEIQQKIEAYIYLGQLVVIPADPRILPLFFLGAPRC